MPFQRKWDVELEDYVSDRTLTGPPKATPETGTATQADGVVIVANQQTTPFIPPATPVSVTFPGPNEPIVGRNGLITPRWWRFLDELYRRTGGVVDNINKAPAAVLGGSGTDDLVLTGYVPSVEIKHFRDTGAASMGFTGYAPTVTVA